MKKGRRQRPWRLFAGILTFMILYMYANFQGGFVSWFLFYTFVAVLIYEVIMVSVLLRHVVVEREVAHQQLFTGQGNRITLHIHTGVIPVLWLRVTDQLPHSLRQAKEYEQLIFLGWRRNVTITYEVVKLPRGEHRWEEVRLGSGDLLGFWSRTITCKSSSEVIVFPRVESIQFWSIQSSHPLGSQQTRRPLQEDMSNLRGIRDYVHGDRLSRIDWKAVARVGNLKTKEFSTLENQRYLFVLDCEMTNYRTEQGLALFEEGVTLIASLAQYLLKQRQPTGLILHGENSSLPQLGEGHFSRMLRALARVTPTATLPFSRALQQLTQVQRLGGLTLIVVTTQNHPEIIEQLARLRQLYGSVVWYHLVDSQQAHSTVVHHTSLTTSSGIQYLPVQPGQVGRVLQGGAWNAVGS